MPTLTLKRIRIASPSETPKTETATALQIHQNDNLTALIHHDRAATGAALVYRDTAATATAAKINENFPSAPSDSTPSPEAIIDLKSPLSGTGQSNRC